MRRFATVVGWAGLALVAGCGAPSPLPLSTPALPPAAPPGAAELRRNLVVLASDSLRGRETGTADERRAATFLASRAAAIGLTPAGDSGYIQRVPLVRTTIGPGTRFAVRALREHTARGIDGLRPLLELGPDFPPVRRSVDGALVFVGYGVERAGHGDDLTRLPIAGRVVVVVNGAPAGADATRRAELESPAAVGVRLQRILALHPAGVVVLLTGASAELYEATGRSLTHGTLSLTGPVTTVNDNDGRAVASAVLAPSPSGAAEGAQVTPMVLLGLPVRGSPLLPRRWPHDDRPQLLPAGHLSGIVETTRTPVESYNVVATLPGRDTARRDTWVALGAHFDHLGIQPPFHGDSIAHGADDDGSGCVALLAVGRALMQGSRPSRSVLFVWHTGEEEGLLGSTYFATHATVPIDSIVAFIDADMVGRNAPDSLFIVGPALTPYGRGRALGALVDSVNATLASPFVFNRTRDAADDPLRIYYRADSYPYGAHNVPVALLTSGSHADYHRVTDVASRIDYTKLARVAGLMSTLTEALANRDRRP